MHPGTVIEMPTAVLAVRGPDSLVAVHGRSRHEAREHQEASDRVHGRPGASWKCVAEQTVRGKNCGGSAPPFTWYMCPKCLLMFDWLGHHNRKSVEDRLTRTEILS